MTAPAPAPAWYVDPYDAARVRWWTGDAWTTAVREHPAAVTELPPLAPPLTPPGVADPPAAPPPPPPTPPPPPAPPPPPTPTPPAESPPPPPSAAPSNATGAPSIGAALLPPLTPPPARPPPGTDPRGSTAPPLAPGAAKRSNKLTIVLVAGLAVAAIALAYGAYSSGMIGASSRDASAPGATVVEGPDFSVEIPDGWSEADADDDLPTSVVVVLSGPRGAEIGIVRSDDPVEVPDDPEIRQRMIDLMLATQTSLITNAEVLSRVPATLGGADAELLTVQGATAAGTTEQAYEVATLHDGRMYVVVLAGPPDLVADSKDDFDAVVASFRFS